MGSVSRSCSGGAMKTLFGITVFVCFLWLLLVEIVTSEAIIPTTPPTTTTTTTTTKGSFKRLDMIPKESHVNLHRSDPNTMSKRKVPNGPDPIHNRRAGKSGQPPGRA